MVKRGREPSKGKWTVPGGLVELGETLAEAAHRELREECDMTVELGDIIETFDVIERDEKGRVKYHYIIVDFIAKFLHGSLKADSDIEDARWVLPAQLTKFDVHEKTRMLISARKKTNFSVILRRILPKNLRLISHI